MSKIYHITSGFEVFLSGDREVQVNLYAHGDSMVKILTREQAYYLIDALIRIIGKIEGD